MGITIITVAVLGFLGMGAPRWGAMIAEALYFPDAWWYATAPGLAIFFVVMGFNMLAMPCAFDLPPQRAEQRRLTEGIPAYGSLEINDLTDFETDQGRCAIDHLTLSVRPGKSSDWPVKVAVEDDSSALSRGGAAHPPVSVPKSCFRVRTSRLRIELTARIRGKAITFILGSWQLSPAVSGRDTTMICWRGGRGDAVPKRFRSRSSMSCASACSPRSIGKYRMSLVVDNGSVW
jgi:hypothetical protein